MSEDIPYATPYPWDNSSMEESQKSGNESLHKEPCIGSGFAALRKNAFGPGSTMGSEAKNLLMTLLQRHNVKINTDNLESDTQADKLYGSTLARQPKETNTPGTPDDEVLELARDGGLSIFSSILKVVESEQPPVTTKTIIRHCCLTLRPGDLPGALDAKEMVMSALHFLSSSFESGSDQLLNLPLISPVQEVGDLEKRSYKKSGEWKLLDITEKLQRLEAIFLSSPTSWRWLRRESFCPRLSQKDETSFCLKGTIPASASAKKTKNDSSRKRKAPASTPAANSPVNDPDSGPVVEATIVADSPGNSVA